MDARTRRAVSLVLLRLHTRPLNLSHVRSTRRPKRGPQFAVMKKLLTLLVDHPSSWAFANPVNAQEVSRSAYTA